MSKTYFTPTHKNGRRLSKAERKAANQAKWAKMQAKTPTKAKLNPRKVKAVAEAFDFAYMDAVSRTYEALPEPLAAAKPKRKKRNSKRVNRNDKLEAQAQRLSRGTAGTNPAPTKEPKAMATSIPSADMEIYDLCGGDPVAAARHAYMTLTNTEDVVFEDVL